MNSPNRPTFLIKTLGCKVNQYESERIREDLLGSGFIEKGHKNSADIYIVNSCTVTHKADRETRRFIRQFHTVNKKATIVVTGCYAEMNVDRKSLSMIEAVTILVRNSDKKRIAKMLCNKFRMPYRKKKFPNMCLSERDRAFVKIQDGCDNKCSYCKVCIVRGPSVSLTSSEILEEISCLVSHRYKEVVLTGVCLGAWADNAKGSAKLPYLLKKISLLNGNFRVRLSSIEPKYITEGLIQTILESPKICRHLHIPLQSGDDKVLEMMNRGYSSSEFLSLLANVRRRLPGFTFTTDIIVGFPGEDDRSFRNTYEFIKKTTPSRIHIFTYSKRYGTKAFNFNSTAHSMNVKKRQKTLGRLADDLALSYAKTLRGKTVSVLVESRRDKATGLLTGYTDTYVRVLVEGPDRFLNSILPTKIVSVSEKGVFGTPEDYSVST